MNIPYMDPMGTYNIFLGPPGLKSGGSTFSSPRGLDLGFEESDRPLFPIVGLVTQTLKGL